MDQKSCTFFTLYAYKHACTLTFMAVIWSFRKKRNAVCFKKIIHRSLYIIVHHHAISWVLASSLCMEVLIPHRDAALSLIKDFVGPSPKL